MSMRQVQLPRLVKKLLVMGLLLGGYALADGGATPVGACTFIYPSCAQCGDVYDYELWACRNNCSFGDYACWYDECLAHASAKQTECQNCCNNP